MGVGGLGPHFSSSLRPRGIAQKAAIIWFEPLFYPTGKMIAAVPIGPAKRHPRILYANKHLCSIPQLLTFEPNNHEQLLRAVALGPLRRQAPPVPGQWQNPPLEPLTAHDSDCIVRRTVVFAYTSTESKVQHSVLVRRNPRQHGS